MLSLLPIAAIPPELRLPRGSLRLVGLRCGTRERTTDMGTVGGDPGDGEGGVEFVGE
jgi:hypothetical protein